MKFPALAIGSILALGLAMPPFANAGSDDLGAPIVELMPHVEKLGPGLGLNAEQKARLEAWAATAPAKRRELESQALALREQLREGILSGADRMTRDDLKQRLATTQTRLIEMRSLCTRMLRQTLDADQFAKVVASYRAG